MPRIFGTAATEHRPAIVMEHLVGTDQWVLFDHLVGASEQRGRHGEAKRLGGFEVITTSNDTLREYGRTLAGDIR